MVRSGAWAQFAAVPADRMTPIPPQVSDAQAAALPTAGLTALRVLEVGGLVLGKRVLVTGATGGVGSVAIALLAKAGFNVAASSGKAASLTIGIIQRAQPGKAKNNP